MDHTQSEICRRPDKDVSKHLNDKNVACAQESQFVHITPLQTKKLLSFYRFLFFLICWLNTTSSKQGQRVFHKVFCLRVK
jgi:hypothetical protein